MATLPLPHRAIAPPRPTTRSDLPPKRKKESRPEIWSNLLRRTREAQARNRSHSIQHRELVICGGSPADQRSFVQSLARPPPPAQPPTRNRDAQRQQKVRGEVKLSNRFAYGYGHVTLYTPLQQGGAGLGLLGAESEEAVRLDVHTLPEAEEGYERTLRRLLEMKKGKDEGVEGDADEGFAGGDVKVEKEGRRPAVALLLSWKEPWKFLALLKRWLQLLASALLPADAAPEDPLEVLKEHNIALTVVVQHVEAQEALEREDYREETFDYISQCLRTCLLPLSAALIYTSPSLPPQQPGSPLSEIQKVLYTSLSLDLAPLSPAPAKGTTPTNRAELAPKHCLVDRMAILIPSNWDSAGKIRLLSETFTPETVLEAWVTDLNIPLHQPPKPDHDETPTTDETKGEQQPTKAGASRPSSRETEQVFTSTSDAGEEDPSLTSRTLSPPRNPISAITTYESTILDPAAHKAPKPPQIEITTTPSQIFLADMRAHLLQLEAEDAKTASKQGESGRDRVATTGSAVGGKSGVGVPGGELTGALGGLGDVQFNLGGVSYNAEAAIERLRKGESPGGGGGYGGLASSSPRTTTPRPPRREDREVSATTPTTVLGGREGREVSAGSARGGGGGGGGKAEDLPVDDLKEYFRSLAKRSGGGTDGGSGSSTPSRGPGK
ncbi:hypothetical protein LTR27_011408 [Elasticomyces elasticus]|nr:hypothetical protein LTR27_011408 [Elasticomyces elasticus]